jgi:hypothetical protein
VEQGDERFLMRMARYCPWLEDLMLELVGEVSTLDSHPLKHGWYLKRLLDVPCSVKLRSRPLDPLIFGREAQEGDVAVLVTGFDFEQ